MLRKKHGYDCPICGYDNLSRPTSNEGGGPSFEICPCCGVQFGYHDCGFPHAALRRMWREAGAPWHSKVTACPPKWNALEQLRLAGLASDPVDECPYCRTPVPAGEPVRHWERHGTAGLLYAATCGGCGADLV